MADAKLSAKAFLGYLNNRRSYYTLCKKITLSNTETDDIVSEALQAVPSPFNSQSNRVIVLHGGEHDKLWDITNDALKAIVPENAFKPTAKKLALFKAAAGTILFFEDQDVVNTMQQNHPLFADKIPIWANQSDAMLQYALWTAFEAEGLGANLQHYNPLIDEKVAAEWNVPATWKLNAQLVFGGRTGETYSKESNPIEEKFKSFSS